MLRSIVLRPISGVQVEQRHLLLERGAFCTVAGGQSVRQVELDGPDAHGADAAAGRTGRVEGVV